MKRFLLIVLVFCGLVGLTACTIASATYVRNFNSSSMKVHITYSTTIDSLEMLVGTKLEFRNANKIVELNKKTWKQLDSKLDYKNTDLNSLELIMPPSSTLEIILERYIKGIYFSNENNDTISNFQFEETGFKGVPSVHITYYDIK